MQITTWLLSLQNQESAPVSPDPFLLLGVGSGDETIRGALESNCLAQLPENNCSVPAYPQWALAMWNSLTLWLWKGIIAVISVMKREVKLNWLFISHKDTRFLGWLYTLVVIVHMVKVLIASSQLGLLAVCFCWTAESWTETFNSLRAKINVKRAQFMLIDL